MMQRGAVIVKFVLYILAAFFISFAWILIPAGWGFIILPAVVGLLLWLIYAVVKSAVKAALREYNEEKAKANG